MVVATLITSGLLQSRAWTNQEPDWCVFTIAGSIELKSGGKEAEMEQTFEFEDIHSDGEISDGMQ